VNGPEGDLVVRSGDINNLGYGWPAGFTPFSGKSTPPHAWPCSGRSGSVPGTDNIMIGSAVTAADMGNGSGDGYSTCTKREQTMPQAVTLNVGALPAKIHDVFLQMFLDDFQAPNFKSQFQVSLNGTRIPSFEATVNKMDQTGPIGKLVTLRLLPEYWPIARAGTVKLLIDDPTTHKLDGYAIDFVRILVNPHFKYAVSVSCTVVDDATSKPIGGASVGAAQVTTTTAHDGTCSMRGIPAGIVSVGASAVGYDSDTQLLDLAAGDHGTADFRLKRHREAAGDLRAQIARTGTVAIYGIRFDTASARLRPDSTASLNEVFGLIVGDKTSRWTISGHTDNQGGAAYNLDLSDARAKSVVAWLIAHGVAQNRLVAAGYGSTRPVADNATVAGRTLNRRVEVGLIR
jgi:outer membrane protein OmpA-like peptidoglycan-associated protein